MAENGNVKATGHFFSSRLKKFEPLVKKRLEEGVLIRKPKELFARLRLDEYVYGPLPSPTCIRLFRIQPGLGSETIRCSLSIVDLNDNPSYIALSYSWKRDRTVGSLLSKTMSFVVEAGRWEASTFLRKAFRLRERNEDESDAHFMDVLEKLKNSSDSRDSTTRHTIICDGRSMTVQPNLYDALLRLRQMAPADYWIDAVCINQQNDQERSAQVHMMASIYRSADQVLVWLGVLPTLLSPGIEKFCHAFGPQSEAGPAIPKKEDGKFSYFGEFILATVYILTRRWFRRLWIVQETCLADDIIFILGDQQINANTIVAAVVWMTDFAQSELAPIFGFANEFISLWETIKTYPTMLASRRFFGEGGKWTLDEWLRVCKGRKASDSKDLVNAGLSLIDPETLVIDRTLQLEEPGEVPSSALWEILHADYTVETSEVLLNVAACLLSRRQGVNQLLAWTLRFRNPPKIGDKLPELPLSSIPSWVPDPSPWTSHVLEPYFMLNCPNIPLPLPSQSKSKIKDPGPRISADGTTLFLTAAYLDKISTECPTIGFLAGDHTTLPRFLEWLGNAVPRVYRPTGQLGVEALVKILTTGYRLQDEANYVHQGEVMEHFCDLLGTSISDAIEETHKKGMTNANRQKVDKLIQFYERVREVHPDIPWSEKPTQILDKLGNPEAVQEDTGKDEEREKSGTDEQRYQNRTLGELLGILGAFWSVPGIVNLSIFTTLLGGYMGIGPAWVREGDDVILLADGWAPFIFAHVEEIAMRKVRRINKELETLANTRTARLRRRELEEELRKVEDSVGGKDDWALVGEAYVEGVMDGEVAATLESRMHRISVI